MRPIPLPLTAAEAKLLRQGAESIFDRALEEVTRGLTNGTRPDPVSVRRELAWAMYRIVMDELDEVAPDDDRPLLAEGSAPHEVCICEPRCILSEEVTTCTGCK